MTSSSKDFLTLRSNFSMQWLQRYHLGQYSTLGFYSKPGSNKFSILANDGGKLFRIAAKNHLSWSIFFWQKPPTKEASSSSWCSGPRKSPKTRRRTSSNVASSSVASSSVASSDVGSSYRHTCPHFYCELFLLPLLKIQDRDDRKKISLQKTSRLRLIVVISVLAAAASEAIIDAVVASLAYLRVIINEN